MRGRKRKPKLSWEQARSLLIEANDKFYECKNRENLDKFENAIKTAINTYTNVLKKAGVRLEKRGRKSKNINTNIESLSSEEKENIQDKLKLAKKGLIDLITFKNNNLEFALTERSINKIIVPVYKKRKTKDYKPEQWPFKISLHFKVDGKEKIMDYSIDRYWGDNNFDMMDCLLYLIRQNFSFPRRPILLFSDEEELKARAVELKVSIPFNPLIETFDTEKELLSRFSKVKYWVKFDSRFFKDFTGNNFMSTETLTNLLIQTAAKFTMTYSVRFSNPKKKNKIEYKTYDITILTSFFDAGWIDSKDKDGNTINRTFYVFFNTDLGEAYVNNILSGGFDTIPKSFFKLPSLAKMFYRHFIIHEKRWDITKTLAQIKEGLNLTDENETQLINYLEKHVFEPLKKDGYISNRTYGYNKRTQLKEVTIYRSDLKTRLSKERLAKKVAAAKAKEQWRAEKERKKEEKRKEKLNLDQKVMGPDGKMHYPEELG